MCVSKTSSPHLQHLLVPALLILLARFQSSIMPNLSGSWTLAKHDSLDAVLDKLQVPADKRPPGTITGLSMTITQNGDNFTVKTVAQRGTRETTFAVGTTFETELLMGTITVKVTAAWDGDSLVLTGEKGAKLCRQIVGGQLVSTIDVGGTCAKFYFNKA